LEDEVGVLDEELDAGLGCYAGLTSTGWGDISVCLVGGVLLGKQGGD